jgi:predicted AlkP superfamily pyrophosphatase or phosphodiesterase
MRPVDYAFGVGFTCVAHLAFANASPPRPRLVVELVVDQFRYDTLLRILPHIGDRGFRRLLSGGHTCTEARYPYASTYTAPGHATIATGAAPERTGIVANEYFDRRIGKATSAVHDPAHPLLTGRSGASPDPLRVETSGDRLVMATSGRSRVVAMALKDRAAVLLGGHRGKAFWFDEEAGSMTTSTYYFSGIPLWVARFNEAHALRAGDVWSLSLAPRDCALYGPDDPTYETDVPGLGRSFPHRLQGAGKVLHDAFTHTPTANQYLLEMAQAALEGEHLGAGPEPDLLAISLTPVDYVGHAFGPDSWELIDMMVKLDGQVAKFLDVLDARFGQTWSLVLTGDHGSCPVPERLSRLGYPAGRIRKATFVKTVEAALTQSFGPGPWVLAPQDPCLYLDSKRIQAAGLDPEVVARRAGEAALSIPGVKGYHTRGQLERAQAQPGSHDLFTSSFDKERSGDVFIELAPYYFWGKYGEKNCGESHGTHYDYDTHVPLVFYGCGVRQGQTTRPVPMTCVAPTVATLLGVEPPVSCQAGPLDLSQP